jgi:putative copper export protein
MVGLALANRYRFLPRMASGDPAARRWMLCGTLGEIVLAGVVLVLVSRFAMLSPFG